MLGIRRRIDMTQIRTTSKLSLKLSCLDACGMDVRRAEELYQYIASGLESLPDFDAVPMSTFEQVKKGAEEVFGWLGQHRDELAQGVEFVRGLRGGKPVKEAAESIISSVPPIPEQ